MKKFDEKIDVMIRTSKEKRGEERRDLERIGRVVDTGVYDFAVAGASGGSKSRSGIEYEYLSASQSELSGHC